MIRAYPKIFAIGTDYIRDIFNEEVEISEKVDGSQFAFGMINEELVIRSKGARLYADNPQKMFQNGIDYVVSIQDRLPENIVFYGEYLRIPKHNTLCYDRVPKNHVVLFGVAHAKEDKFIPEFDDLASALDLEIVPRWKATIKSPEDLKDYLECDSYLGGTKIEGVVVKNYQRPFLLGGQPIPVMAGKYVSEAFKEVHSKRWKTEEGKKGKWESYCESFRTEARWRKAIQHLAESDNLTNTPKDIGTILREVKADIESEETDAIKKFLWDIYSQDIMRSAVKGLPEWYKNQLVDRSFSK